MSKSSTTGRTSADGAKRPHLRALTEYITSISGSGLAEGVRLDKIEVPRRILVELRKELNLAPDADIVVDGVPIHAFADERIEPLSKGIRYAAVRWNTIMSQENVESLMKAVPDDELMGLIPIMIDQHMDMHNMVDPVDAMDEDALEDMLEEIEELGFDRPEV